MFLVNDEPIGAGGRDSLGDHSGGNGADVSSKRLFALEDAILHARHDCAPDARTSATAGSLHARSVRSHEVALKKLKNVAESKSKQAMGDELQVWFLSPRCRGG